MSHATLYVNCLLAAGALAVSLISPGTTRPTGGLFAFIAPAKAARPAAFRASRTATKKSRFRPAIAAVRTYTVTATGYEAVPGQTDDEPFITADNSRIRPHYTSRKRWMALSRDLLKQWGGEFRYGDRVRIRGLSPTLDGVYTVHDTMNRRHRHCMDVLVHPSEKFDLLCKGVKIQKVAPL